MKISVIIPCLNSEHAIGAALTSLASQRRLPHEVLVVDNGSSDQTRNRVREFIRHEKRLHVHLLGEPKPGPAAARNRGLAQAQGEIVAFMDSDCLAHPDWIFQLEQCYQDADVWAVGGIVQIFQPKTAVEKYQAIFEIGSGKIPGCDFRQATQLMRDNWMTTNNCSYRMAGLQAVKGFDEDFRVGEDLDLYLRYIAIVPPQGRVLLHQKNLVMFHQPRRTFRQLARQIYGYREALARLIRRHLHGRLILSVPGMGFYDRLSVPIAVWVPGPTLALIGAVILGAVFYTWLPWLVLILLVIFWVRIFRGLRRCGLSASAGQMLEMLLISIGMHLVSRSGKIAGSIRYKVLCL